MTTEEKKAQAKELGTEEKRKKTEVKEKSMDENKETVEEKVLEGKTEKTTVEKSKPPKIEFNQKAEDILKTIENMSVLELSNLVKALEEKFGVSAAMPMMAQPAGFAVTPGAEGSPVEEKTSFTVVLANVGDKKIQVIKEIRAVTNLGLKEAKDLVDSAPKPIKEGIPKEEAEKIKGKLEAVGATIELK